MKYDGLSESTVTWLNTLSIKEKKNHLSYIVGDLSQELEQASYNDDSVLTHVLFRTAEEEIKNLPEMVIKYLETQYPNINPISSLGDVLVELVKELRLWPMDWLAPIPLYELGKGYREIFIKSGNELLLCGSVCESSFKELMGDIQGFAPVDVRDIIIETLKNITHQSFGDKNIFESSLVNFKERVKYKYGSFPNQLTRLQYGEMTDYQGLYSEFISGLSIPLVSPKWSVGSRARLVIAIPDDLPIPQISVQFYVDNVDKWVSVPCRTNTVKETIMNLFPQE